MLLTQSGNQSDLNITVPVVVDYEQELDDWMASQFNLVTPYDPS